MYEILENISEDNNWRFVYARKDYQNLYEEVDKDQIHLFLDPVKTATDFNERNQPIKTTYSGSFMLLVDSDFDEDYGVKYQKHIKPLFDDAIKVINEAVRCEDMDINSWGTTEVVNLYDQNLDGLIVTYSVSCDK